MLVLEDIICGISGALNSINQSVMAMSFGFAMLPSALAYLVGILFCVIFRSALPLSFQAETIIMAGSLGRDRRERLTIVFCAGLGMALLGGIGLLDDIIALAGDNIISAMMCGVGIMLCRLAFDMGKRHRIIGWLSIGTSIIMYLLTQNIGYASLVPIILCAVAARVLKIETEVKMETGDRFQLQKPIFNFTVVRGVLAVMCLTIGGNIAASGITSGMSGLETDVNIVSVYSGLADALSSMFGGSPISVVISPSAAAPHPVVSAMILMAIMMVILLSRQLPKIIRLLPEGSVAGVLFVLGSFMTLPENLSIAFSGAAPGDALACSVTLAVTAVCDPFVGMIAGMVVRVIAAPLGLA